MSPVIAPPRLRRKLPPVGVPVRVTTCTRLPERRYAPETPRLKYVGYPPIVPALKPSCGESIHRGRPVVSVESLRTGRRRGSAAYPVKSKPASTTSFSPLTRSVYVEPVACDAVPSSMLDALFVR